MQFSFTHNPEQDRILMMFQADTGQPPPGPVWLTRRMTILLARYLRQYIEKQTALPEEIDAVDRQSAFKFIHQGEVQAQPPRWSKPGDHPDRPVQDMKKAVLMTRVEIKYRDQAIALNLYDKERFLLTVRFEWHQVHAFLNALWGISVKAGWDLDHVFDWAVTLPPPQNGNNPNNIS